MSDDMRTKVDEASRFADYYDIVFSGLGAVGDGYDHVRIEAFEHIRSERDALAARVETLENAAEFMWVVICNVSEGDWTKQTPEWQEAAARARAQWHAALASRPDGEAQG